MADDIENQVIKMVKNSPFYSNQLDESTDVSNKVLLCFVRVIHLFKLYMLTLIHCEHLVAKKMS